MNETVKVHLRSKENSRQMNRHVGMREGSFKASGVGLELMAEEQGEAGRCASVRVLKTNRRATK